MLVGFAGAFRGGELVALDWEDIEYAPEGLVVTIRRGKTDPEGQGRKIAIPYGRTLCPVRALASWQALTGDDTGPVFRPVDHHGNVRDRRLSDKAVARVVKCALEAARGLS